MTTMQDRLALERIEYRKPISIANQFLDFVMDMRSQAPIKITPNYPRGWSADVPAEDKIWTIICDRGEIKLVKVADFSSFTYNGNYDIKNEEEIDEYQQHFLAENYYDTGGPVPITCDLFCNSNEAICRFCPKERNKKRCFGGEDVDVVE